MDYCGVVSWPWGTCRAQFWTLALELVCMQIESAETSRADSI